MVHPIIDEYYSYNPYHQRSSKFVQDKGLITNEKGTLNSPAGTPGISAVNKKLTSSPLNSAISNAQNNTTGATFPPSHTSEPPPSSRDQQHPTTPPSDLRNVTNIESLHSLNNIP